MKMFSVLFMTLVATAASANIGGNSGAYALRGYFECGPSDGVSVAIDMDAKNAVIIGKTQVGLSLVSGGVMNGNSAYQFEGNMNGAQISMSFTSIMGGKLVKFSHPSGKQYQMTCKQAQRPQAGF